VAREEIPESLADDARKGVTNCPEGAIEVGG
jgi:ferredoxin